MRRWFISGLWYLAALGIALGYLLVLALYIAVSPDGRREIREINRIARSLDN